MMEERRLEKMRCGNRQIGRGAKPFAKASVDKSGDRWEQESMKSDD
jgi:hypothetical protein